MGQEMTLSVNGRKHTFYADASRTLQDALRGDLSMTGTKNCCNDGYCGACTVLMDGVAVKSCLVLAVEAQETELQTIEGLGSNDELDPIQAAFIEHGAAQCGMCTPGMIMSARGLLDENPDPTEDEIKEAIKGNLCRCTGYVKIVEAIASVAQRTGADAIPHTAQGQGGLDLGKVVQQGKRVAGHSVPRVDGREKVTGRADYVADMTLPGMLYGEILRSPIPHARIVSIDADEALKIPGVFAVITGKDMPPNKFGAFVPDETGLAVDTVRYVGDAVAAVAASTPEIARNALNFIDVQYEELPFVTDPEEAMKEGAPQIAEAERNIVAHNRVIGGDVEQGFAEADFVFEDRFETTKQAHACMEPHVCIGQWDSSGKITLYDSTQSTFFMRFHLSNIFGLQESKIRVTAPYLGGGFGSKSEVHAIHVCSIILSKKTGRPVKMGHDRDEEFTSSRTRHKEIIYLKTGVKRDGTITARQARVILDNGAYTSYGPGVSLTQSMLGGAVYRIPHYRYDGYVVYTNTPMGGAFRGFGSPQFTFAAESQADMIAKRLNMDPAEFRRINLTHPGDKAISGPTLTTNGARESLEKALQRLEYTGHSAAKQPYKGVGFAVGTHFTSGKFHPEANADFCGATVKVNIDGSVNVLAGVIEMGTGCATTLSQIAAEELGVDMEDVEITLSDSEFIPPDLGTFGSRATTLGGNAVRMACQRVKAQLAEEAAKHLNCSPQDIAFENKQLRSSHGQSIDLRNLVAGMLFRDGGGTHVMASAHYDAPCSLPDPETGVGDFAMSYSFGCHAVEVEVDPDTGKVTILKFIAATDCGNLINPAGAEGQVQGGAMQGIGYALYEDLKCPDGQPINTRFGNYKIPTVMTVPPIEAIWVETDDPNGVYGSKGLAEMGLVPTAAAIANAVEDAIGVRITDLPITPEKILKALETAVQA
ncbi:molybdopterin-dependent oxidoreductase [Alicyclobacillus tolerans]|uniref:molybdopterin-dependent oxidoreductase n=1 Tax=Alicyclobacillus tolerans TaxID=90970 RepID=UPI001F2594B6|nr:molybdopterin-dependent oxidoreductase [Alicyclobacillus tolerans]MCF8563201.1 molybdopterin-dependent oxidoreductase [Alicyclobacillus tolerans]